MKLLLLTSALLLGLASATHLHDKLPHIQKTYKWVKVPKLEIVKPEFGIKEKVLAGKEKTWALISSLVSKKPELVQPVIHEKKTVVYPAWKIHKYKGIEIRPVQIIHSKTEGSSHEYQAHHKVVHHSPQWNHVYAPQHQLPTTQIHHVPSYHGVSHAETPSFSPEHKLVHEAHAEIRVPASEYGVPQEHTHHVPSSHHGVPHSHIPGISIAHEVHLEVPSLEYGPPKEHAPHAPSSHYRVPHLHIPGVSIPHKVHSEVPSLEYGPPHFPHNHHTSSDYELPLAQGLPASEYGPPQEHTPHVPLSHYGVPDLQVPDVDVSIPHKVHSEAPSLEYGPPNFSHVHQPSSDYGLPLAQGPQVSNSYHVVHNEPAIGHGLQQEYGAPSHTPATSYQVVNHGIPPSFQAPHYTVYAPQYDTRSASDDIPQYDADVVHQDDGKTSQWAPIYVPDRSPVNVETGVNNVLDTLSSLPEVAEVNIPELPTLQQPYPLNPPSETNFHSFNYESYPPYNHQTLRDSYGNFVSESSYSPSENVEVVVPGPGQQQQPQPEAIAASEAVDEGQAKAEDVQKSPAEPAQQSAEVSKEEKKQS